VGVISVAAAASRLDLPEPDGPVTAVTVPAGKSRSTPSSAVSRPASRVEVTLSYMDDSVALDVVDDGVGFDPAAQPVPGGSPGGYGLAAMCARARAGGATRSVESALGEGTRLPSNSPREHCDPHHLPTVRLLLADDHPVVRRACGVLNTEPGFTVVAEAATAKQAVTLALSRPSTWC
jgi:hypothetical protein